MKLVGRIPVEPLDDQRLTNIERRIVTGAASPASRSGRAPLRWGGILAAAALAVLVGMIGWRLGARGPGAPSAATSTLAVAPAPAGATLDIGDARITTDPTTRFVLSRPDGGVLVELARGKVELEVGKRGGRPPLIVRAGDTDVIVVGTRFSVDAGDGTGAVDVRVTEGVVRVVRRGVRSLPASERDLRVAAGNAWQTTRGLRALAVARAEDSVALATAADSATASLDRSATAASDPGAPDARLGDQAYATAGTAAPEVLHDRVTQVPGALPRPGARPTRDGTSTGPAPPTATSAHTLQPTIGLDDPRRALKQLILAQPLEPALDVGVLDAAALGAYYTIIREQDGEAEARAFYSIAVIQHTRLGRDGDAEKTLGDYQRRFAGTSYPTNAPALWLRTRMRCLRAIDDACRQAASAYVTRGSDGPAHAIAERLTLTD